MFPCPFWLTPTVCGLLSKSRQALNFIDVLSTAFTIASESEGGCTPPWKPAFDRVCMLCLHTLFRIIYSVDGVHSQEATPEILLKCPKNAWGYPGIECKFCLPTSHTRGEVFCTLFIPPPHVRGVLTNILFVYRTSLLNHKYSMLSRTFLIFF